MTHKVFIRHTYIYKCGNEKCSGEWKINEADTLEILNCPHCGYKAIVEFVLIDQREKYNKKWSVT